MTAAAPARDSFVLLDRLIADAFTDLRTARAVLARTGGRQDRDALVRAEEHLNALLEYRPRRPAPQRPDGVGAGCAVTPHHLSDPHHLNEEDTMSTSLEDLLGTSRVPDSVPVLGRGRHRSPARGACFMEYTSLLAGERFSDHPRCVDGELASVLRGANDKLSNAHRPVLVPLLGRSIGLVAQLPEPCPADAPRHGRAAARRRREQVEQYVARATGLRRAVTRLFAAALELTGPAYSRDWTGRRGELAQLFWDTMREPAPVSTPDAYAARLVERLSLLHECYEQALTPEPPGVPAVPVPVAGEDAARV